MQSLHAEEATHRLMHLPITSNGALEGEDNTALLQKLVWKADEGIAAEAGLKVIGVDTNLQELQSELFLSVAAFRHSAVTLRCKSCSARSCGRLPMNLPAFLLTRITRSTMSW